MNDENEAVAGVLFIVGLVVLSILFALSMITVDTTETHISNLTWTATTELRERYTTTECDYDFDEKGQLTSVSCDEVDAVRTLKRAVNQGTYKEDLVQPSAFNTNNDSDRYNSFYQTYTIIYQNGHYKNTNKDDWNKRYIGQACVLGINMFGGVVKDECGAGTGR